MRFHCANGLVVYYPVAYLGGNISCQSLPSGFARTIFILPSRFSAIFLQAHQSRVTILARKWHALASQPRFFSAFDNHRVFLQDNVFCFFQIILWFVCAVIFCGYCWCYQMEKKINKLFVLRMFFIIINTFIIFVGYFHGFQKEMFLIDVLIFF